MKYFLNVFATFILAVSLFSLFNQAYDKYLIPLNQIASTLLLVILGIRLLKNNERMIGIIVLATSAFCAATYIAKIIF